MRYGSVCSGVEAATVAWHPLGWEPQWFSEIEKFPSAVLAHHYPSVPNLGDMTEFKEWPDDPIDLLVGGTPCQSFSSAGLRKGLADPRGNLMLTYLAIAERYRPRWLVWENVPGVLSSNGGRDFGTFLMALGQLRYGFSWRILDAQYFGVAQRRRRVFVVGYLGDWRRAAAVLFERESLSGHPAPSRETREEVAGYTTSSFGNYTKGVGTVRAAGGDLGGGSETLVAKCITRGVGQRYDQETETSPIAFPSEMSGTQSASARDISPALSVKHTIAIAPQVRRLTPRECERLQGFPDDYTLIQYRNKDAADTPRYKAMGNSMAVPVMRWIGKQIKKVEAIQ
jgi:DNA (cytosine-5)-methyltransferase 1